MGSGFSATGLRPMASPRNDRGCLRRHFDDQVPQLIGSADQSWLNDDRGVGLLQDRRSRDSAVGGQIEASPNTCVAPLAVEPDWTGSNSRLGKR